MRCCSLALLATVVACNPVGDPEQLQITNPAAGALFPRDIAAPTVRWQDPSNAVSWQVSVFDSSGSSQPSCSVTTQVPEWRPDEDRWELIKAGSVGSAAAIEVIGLTSSERQVSRGSVSIRISPDEVGAPIFYRQVPLPFSVARTQLHTISWHLGWVSGEHEPRTVLADVKTCANCHSFSADGRTIALDIDYGSDKGTYAIASVESQVTITPEDLISWRNFRAEDGHRTFGLLARISPNGRWVISTVKETSVLVALPDPYCSQLFFPLSGILAVYDRTTDTFTALPGADDPAFVHTSPEWSPDGQWIVFARAPAVDLSDRMQPGQSVVPAHLAQPFEDGTQQLRYNLYRMPFRNGAGGPPEPLTGAAHNGRSNYFARFSPDGRWIVFTQAESFMFNRPDSELFIMPASGGTPRRLASNTAGRMNSWHSWSPNGTWLAFASKAHGPYTQIWLTQIDQQGNDSPPVVLDHLQVPGRAINLPEFVNLGERDFHTIGLSEEIRTPAR